ncbi:hypothetical protein AALP_AA2G053200 [Arabis alpina]|uniref:Uncharacterized protein n=1 Tax=Arabis alpina TaxID=50452 RepID=A0A087HFH3_ARAAL|nr:hypothetical protein AALP_AA2G053200 [Arabis alpina]
MCGVAVCGPVVTIASDVSLLREMCFSLLEACSTSSVVLVHEPKASVDIVVSCCFSSSIALGVG